MIEMSPTGTEDLCQKSSIYLDLKTHYIWYHSFLGVPRSDDVLEIAPPALKTYASNRSFMVIWEDPRCCIWP